MRAKLTYTEVEMRILAACSATEPRTAEEIRKRSGIEGRIGPRMHNLQGRILIRTDGARNNGRYVVFTWVLTSSGVAVLARQEGKKAGEASDPAGSGTGRG